MNSNTDYDVIIVGGGMVGACMACCLASPGLRIAVIEGFAAKLDWPNDGFDLRVSAISQASKNIFSAIQAWPYMLEERVSPYSAMHVWDSTGDGAIHFDSADIGEACLGYIIENRVILKGLLQQLKTNPHVDFLCPESPVQMNTTDEQVEVTLEGEKTLSGKLLIAADGANSWVRHQTQISCRQNDYAQSAVVTTVKTQRPHQSTARQRFLPSGPLAFLPLTDGYSSIVWSTSTEEAESLLNLSDAEFKQALQTAFDNTLGEIISVDQRAAFPLRSQHANQYVVERTALIGDAAHSIHPLAGQGVNLGFADAASLAQVIIEAHTQHKDIGLLPVLRRYERWRKGDNLAMLNAMTGFNMLFGNTTPILRQARNLGLNLTNSLTPVKNMFMRHAMGLSGDLPELARPQIS